MEWSTLAEFENYGFRMQKRPLNDSTYVTIPGSFIPGEGAPFNYSYLDTDALGGWWQYRLVQYDLAHNPTYYGPVTIGVITVVAPSPFHIDGPGHGQNYPNPFNSSTRLSFVLNESSYVRLAIYDILGREIRVLVEDKLPVGAHAYVWQANNAPSGTYFARFITRQWSATQKLLLLK